MTWKSYIVMSGAGLLATYLASAPPAVAPQPTSAPNNPSAPVAAPILDIRLPALQQDRQSAGEYKGASRDPFRFVERAARGARVPRDEPAAPPVIPIPPAPEPPAIRLSGIATRRVDGAPQRTAILITAQGVVQAREGELVASDYRVTRVEDDAVELNGPEGVILRLPLRP